MKSRPVTRFCFVPLAQALLALLFAGQLSAEVFTLTDKQSRSIKADVLSVDGNKASIKRDDGQVFTLDLGLLVADDQKKLKEWAANEAAKPLPPGALQLELSRGIFKTEKTDSDVTLVGGEVIKNGRTTTEEKWGYSVTISNKTPLEITGLRTEYRLFASIDDVHVKEKQGLKKKAYRATIESIPALSKTVFRTETISAIKMKYNGNIVSAKTGDSSSRETLTGIWIRVYRGDELVQEVSMPEKLRTSETW
jgi:hypothetical protein